METSQLTTNLLIQYILVGAILLAISVWIVWKLIKIKRQGPKSCCGCSLSESCGKKPIKNKTISNDCRISSDIVQHSQTKVENKKDRL